jgi:hypothetical protein
MPNPQSSFNHVDLRFSLQDSMVALIVQGRGWVPPAQAVGCCQPKVLQFSEVCLDPVVLRPTLRS